MIASLVRVLAVSAVVALGAGATPPAASAAGGASTVRGTHLATSVPAAAAPGPVSVASVSDSTLSGLGVTGASLSTLAPVFATGTHDYQVIDNDDLSATITATASDSGATVVVAKGGVTYPLTAGAASVPLVRGRNAVTVTVTSANGTSSTVYRVTPRIVGLSETTTSVFGGDRTTITLADGQLPPGCSRAITIGGQNVYRPATAFDPATGLTRDVIRIPSAVDRVAGTVDLVATTTCFAPGAPESVSQVTATDAVTYLPGVSIDAIEVPPVLTAGSEFVVRGAHVNGSAGLNYWLEDGQGRRESNVYEWGWSGNDHAEAYVDYSYNAEWHGRPGPRTLHVGYCPPGRDPSNDPCTTLTTRTVGWRVPVPEQVSFSPSSGPVTGGTTMRVRGRFISSGDWDSVVRVGAQTVSSYTRVSTAEGQSPFHEYTSSPDVIEFTVPPATAPGPVQVTVTNPLGATVARGVFTYSPRPAVTSISPATVANSGGSVVTVDGSGFGTAGRPTVVIDGVKSASVTRVSATRVTAVVPASSSTGPVAVTVSSPQGGGVSPAASLTLAAPSTLPTIGAVSPTSGRAGDVIRVTGTGFGAVGTVGVRIGGQWTPVTASSPTGVTFELPPGTGTGAQPLLVGTTTGSVTRSSGLTVLPEAAVTTVTPASVTSYATGAAARIRLDGAGFGATGTVKVGAAASVGYTSTLSGTRISGVAVPTGVAAQLPVVITPAGAATPLRASVRVTGPVIGYVGPSPRQAPFAAADIDSGTGGLVLGVPTTGGTAMRIEGSGFGTAGALRIAGSTAATSSWSDTAITFTAPAHALGVVGLTLTPTGSTPAAARTAAIRYVTAAPARPRITRIASVVDHGRNDRNEFDPVNDLDDAFTLTGTDLAGTDPSRTRVTVWDGTDSFTLTPSTVTAGALSFAAPRAFTNPGWKIVTVTTDLGSDEVNLGIYYPSAGATISVSPADGLCLRTPTAATGSVTHTPAVVTIANSASLFDSAGTVTVDGVAVSPTSYATGQVVVSMADLAADLADPWGAKSIVITPADTSMPAQRVGFTCGVTPTVTTTANGSTAHLTVPAGTAYTMGNTTTGFVGASPFTVAAPGGYEYVTADVYGSTGFSTGVRAGAPTAAGDYYVRVALSRAGYAAQRYLAFTPAPVHVTIAGTPVTLTPVSDNGSSFAYKGQLGDGTGGSPADLHHTATTTADPITAVTWEYRDTVCQSVNATAGWTEGLPKNVARSSSACGGDGATPSQWEVRVKSFEMKATGTDRSSYYAATTPSTTITITPRSVSIASVRADRRYDGTDVAAPGALTLTGAVAGETVTLDNTSLTATFADAAPGVDKPVSLNQDLALAGAANGNYTLTNPQPSILGTITRARAVLGLSAAPTTVLLSQNTPVTITDTVLDADTGAPPPGGANLAPVVLVSQTPSICTVSGSTVTAVAAGTCVIAGSQAASTNYQAAVAASDPTSLTETVEIQVFPAPQTITVVADDLTVPVGDPIDPTSQVSGLFDGDSVDTVSYDFYSGATLLGSPPSSPGTYRVVPRDGTLNAATTAVYANPGALGYVPGILVITPLPPTIGTYLPTTGPTTGGTSVTITGDRLDTVRTVRIGAVTLRPGQFTVNPDGTSLTFTTPAVANPGVVDLVLTAGTAVTTDVYSYTTATGTVPGAPAAVDATGLDRSTRVSFVPPTSTGGAAITAYQVSVDGGRTWRTVSTRAGAGGTRTAVVPGLLNGVAYSVKVRAVNVHGPGSASAPDTVVPNAPALGPIDHPASQIPVPARPRDYRGPQVFTRALNTTRSGGPAHPIPDLGARQLTRGEAATLSENGLFDFDSARLTAKGRAEVAFLAARMRLARTVTCEGYTDYAGSADHELDLSRARARAVCAALVGNGARVRTTALGYGGSRPVIVGGTPQSRAANRRVVVLVTG